MARIAVLGRDDRRRHADQHGIAPQRVELRDGVFVGVGGVEIGEPIERRLAAGVNQALRRGQERLRDQAFEDQLREVEPPRAQVRAVAEIDLDERLRADRGGVKELPLCGHAPMLSCPTRPVFSGTDYCG